MIGSWVQHKASFIPLPVDQVILEFLLHVATKQTGLEMYHLVFFYHVKLSFYMVIHLVIGEKHLWLY